MIPPDVHDMCGRFWLVYETIDTRLAKGRKLRDGRIITNVGDGPAGRWFATGHGDAITTPAWSPSVTVLVEGDCPSCGTAWGYERGGQRYSRLIGRVWNDKVQEWHCPDCGTRFDRWTGAVISPEAPK